MSGSVQRRGMSGKDVITVGIFSAIYFVINFAFMLLGGLHPLLWILMPGFIALFTGIPYLMMCAKVQKVDPRWFSTIALSPFALVLWMRSHFNTQADQLAIMIPTLVQGVAMAFFFIPLSLVAGLFGMNINVSCCTSLLRPPLM